MHTNKRKLLIFVSTLLTFCVVLQACWIFSLQRQVETLHSGNMTNTAILIDETIQRIDNYLETGDPQLLPHLYTRLRIMGQEMHQLSRSLDDPHLYPSPNEHGPTRPDILMEKMIKNGTDSGTVAAHLQEVRDRLQQFRDADRYTRSDYETNAKEALALWRDLVVLANTTNRQLQHL